MAFCVGQALEVAREPYSCVVEAGVWVCLVLDSNSADAVFLFVIPSVVVLSRMFSGFGKIDVAFVFLVFLV